MKVWKKIACLLGVGALTLSGLSLDIASSISPADAIQYKGASVYKVTKSNITSVYFKLAVLFLILVIGMTSFATPASASEGFYEKEPFAIELAKETTKEAAKAGAIFLAPPALCLTADAIATTFFPPAAALAPYCAALAIPAGTTGAAISGATGSMKIAQKAMAH